jgi:hypothetical protein
MEGDEGELEKLGEAKEVIGHTCDHQPIEWYVFYYRGDVGHLLDGRQFYAVLIEKGLSGGPETKAICLQ